MSKNLLRSLSSHRFPYAANRIPPPGSRIQSRGTNLVSSRGSSSQSQLSSAGSFSIDPDNVIRAYKLGKVLGNEMLAWLDKKTNKGDDTGPKDGTTRPWKPVVQKHIIGPETQILAIFLPGLLPSDVELTYDYNKGIIQVFGESKPKGLYFKPLVSYLGYIQPPGKAKKKNGAVLYGVRMDDDAILKIVVDDKFLKGDYPKMTTDPKEVEKLIKLDNFPGVHVW